MAEAVPAPYAVQCESLSGSEIRVRWKIPREAEGSALRLRFRIFRRRKVRTVMTETKEKNGEHCLLACKLSSFRLLLLLCSFPFICLRK